MNMYKLTKNKRTTKLMVVLFERENHQNFTTNLKYRLQHYRYLPICVQLVFDQHLDS